ncbi:hypothetical protein TNCV_2756711 [Trichonephila clavipes]|nr:hypothetical protein TNCV_2756711 [Trichonephila clavipes]
MIGKTRRPWLKRTPRWSTEIDDRTPNWHSQPLMRPYQMPMLRVIPVAEMTFDKRLREQRMRSPRSLLLLPLAFAHRQTCLQ